MKEDIRRLNLSQLSGLIKTWGEKDFRARQLYEWLWQKGAVSFDSMSNISKGLREKLACELNFDTLCPDQEYIATDGTKKVAFRTRENYTVESVLIPDKKRLTVCVSSQAGCPLGCTFCATGALGFQRNLSAGEIFDQVFYATGYQPEEGSRLTNIVFMGMGEPLLNYEQVKLAIHHITAADGLGMSAKRLTLSTVGLVKPLRTLADDQPAFQIAVSLHTANDEKRQHIIPSAKANPLNELAKAIAYYHQKTGQRITFEYLMLNEFNDSLRDARELAEFCRIVPCKVNLIEYNPTGHSFTPSNPLKVKEFKEFLEGRNMIVNVRRSKGAEIKAACGQLAGQINTQATNGKRYK